MNDIPTSPDLQAEAERVFADVQRAVLVEDAKQVIAKALKARDERAAEIADSWEATCRQLADYWPSGHDTRIQNILCADAIADVASCIREAS